VEISLAPGFHVYAEPLPEGYTPLSLDVDPGAGVERGAVVWPAPHRFAIDGLDEEFWVHEGTIRASLPLTFTAAPGAGDHTVRATVRYQACSRSACLPPAAVRLEFPVREVALVERELPAKAG
jgi:DsbC/DsbD-like thiol-disulfide interchange protein